MLRGRRKRFTWICCLSATVFAALLLAVCPKAFALAADYGPDELKMRGSVGGQVPIHGYWVNWEDIFFYAGDAEAFNQFIAAYADWRHRRLELVIHRGPKQAASPWRQLDVSADWSLYVWNSGVPFNQKILLNKAGDEEVELVPIGEPAPTRVDAWIGPRLKLSDLRIPPTLKVTAASDAGQDAEIQEFMAARVVEAAMPTGLAQQSAERLFRLTAELNDGSRLKGQARDLKDVALRTKFGKLSVPPDQIESIQFEFANSAATVQCRNGDRFTGVLEAGGWENLKLSTVVGDLTIPAQLLHSCAVEGPFQKAKPAVRASSSWEVSVTERAFDGRYDTDWNSGDYAPAWIEADLSASATLATILLSPAQDIAGETTHEIWVSDEPIGDDRSKAMLAHTLHGPTSDHQPLRFDFPKDQRARYVQVRTTQSPTWIAWWEVELLVGAAN